MHMNIVCVIVLGPISLIRFHAPFAIWIAYCFVDECWMNRNSVLCSMCNAFCNCKLFDVSYSNKVIWTWTWIPGGSCGWLYELYKTKTFCCAFFAAAMLTMVAAATIVRFPPVTKQLRVRQFAGYNHGYGSESNGISSSAKQTRTFSSPPPLSFPFGPGPARLTSKRPLDVEARTGKSVCL